MYHRSFNGSSGWSSGWENMGGKFLSEPAAVAWDSNRLDVFGQGMDSSIWWQYWDGSSWSSKWQSLGGGCSSPPTVVSWGPGRLDLFVIGTDGSLWHKWYNNGVWSPSQAGWESLGGGFSSTVSVVTSSFFGRARIDIFGIGTDNALWHKAWDGTWSPSLTGWNKHYGSFGSAPAAASWGSNRLDVFGLAPAGQGMSHQAWNGSAWSPEISSGDSLGGGFKTFA